MELKAYLTKGDYTALRRFAMLRLRKTWLLFIPCAALFGWVCFPRDYATQGIPLVAAIVLTSVVAMVVAVLLFFISMAVTLLMPNRPSTILGEHVFTLTDSEFQEKNGAGSASLKLAMLRRYETTKHVFLLSPTHVGYILPMRDLQTNPEFLRTLRERTKTERSRG